MTTTTRHLGNCQICEGDQKLHNGLMVHHGYTRPGHGYIVGDCPGVGEVPYEVSCDLVKKHIVNLHGYVKDQNEYLGRLQAGAITVLYVEEYRGFSKRETVRLEAGTPEAEKLQYGRTKWENALRSAVANTESNIRHAKFDIERCEKRVATWEPKPIRTVEEEQARQDADKAARKAEKDAARAAKEAKKAATKAKQDALQAKRDGVRQDFESKFVALAASPAALADRQRDARALLSELDKTKYRSWLGRWDLRCEEAFVALGMAKEDGRRGDGRPYLRWL